MSSVLRSFEKGVIMGGHLLMSAKEGRRKRARDRARRVRKEHFGELVQMDGSHHEWFGPGQPSPERA